VGSLADGKGDVNWPVLTSLLSVLAGMGVRCSRFEWDGVPTVVYDAMTEEWRQS
jgi:hypothetical protein